ncbi:hypothetical protein [Reichenbachiella sp. MSK19-1]|uniref:hypothetical protein n=1 Tax=Reichenbachiella sp. MSK19-1 TaxID=1897631 RepID=UPI0011C47581|nr:hypothetical protein [Reichenbachiella sp. MSK19-1]
MKKVSKEIKGCIHFLTHFESANQETKETLPAVCCMMIVFCARAQTAFVSDLIFPLSKLK